MLKRLFDWTPRDIAYWEKIRKKGLRRFIQSYGLVITGGLLFLIFGLITVFIWIRQVAGYPFTLTSLFFLLWQLLVVALVCLIAGVINSLITWVVEERLYRKYKQATSQ